MTFRMWANSHWLATIGGLLGIGAGLGGGAMHLIDALRGVWHFEHRVQTLEVAVTTLAREDTLRSVRLARSDSLLAENTRTVEAALYITCEMAQRATPPVLYQGCARMRAQHSP